MVARDRAALVRGSICSHPFRPERRSDPACRGCAATTVPDATLRSGGPRFHPGRKRTKTILERVTEECGTTRVIDPCGTRSSRMARLIRVLPLATANEQCQPTVIRIIARPRRPQRGSEQPTRLALTDDRTSRKSHVQQCAMVERCGGLFLTDLPIQRNRRPAS